MERFKVIYSQDAFDDIRGIYVYIADVLQAPLSAKRQVNRIKKEIISLDFMPERYKLVEWEPWFSMNVHILSVNKYSIFYQINYAKNIVVIVRIFYGGRDLPNIIYSDI